MPSWDLANVHIDGSLSYSGPARGGPRLNEICHISDIVIMAERHVCLTLRGHGNERYIHTGFRALRERPKETSIEVFRGLLEPNKELVVVG